MRARWKVYGLIVAMSAGEGLLAMLVPPYLHDLGYDFSTIGLLVALMGITALASRLPSGAVYRLERGRVLMGVSLLCMGLVCLAYPLAGTALLFGLVRVANGLVFGVASTANLAMYMDTLATGRDRARAMGMYAGSMAAGHMLGNLSGGFLGDSLGYTMAFVLAAGYPLLALVLLLADRSPVRTRSSHRSPVRAEPVEALVGLRERWASSWKQLAARARMAASEPSVAALALVALFLNMFHQIGFTFFPLYAVSIGFSLTEIGIMRSVHSLVNAVARPLAAPVIDRFGHQRVSYAGIGLIGLALALIPTLGTFVGLMGILFVIGLLRALTLVSNTVGIADIDEKRISRGLASGIYNASKDIGNLSGPVIGGAAAAAVGLVAMFALVPPLIAAMFYGLVISVKGQQAKRSANTMNVDRRAEPLL